MKIFPILIGIALLLGSTHTGAQNLGVELLFWHPYAEESRAAFWNTLADEFNAAHNNIHLQIGVYPSYNEQHDALLRALVNGGLPDVALVRNHHATLYQLSDALVDLQQFAQSELPRDTFYPHIWASDAYRGQQLGIPLYRASTALYVNRDALQELGALPPRTPADLIEQACTYQQQDGWSRTRAVRPVALEIPLDGDYLYTEGIYDGQEFDFAPFVERLQRLRAWLRTGCVSLLTETHAAAQNRFARGQRLFYIDSTDAYTYIQQATARFFAEPFVLDILPLPAPNGPQGVLNAPSLSLFRSMPEQEAAAWTWIAWVARPQHIARWLAINPGIPARKDVPMPPILAPFKDAAWQIPPHMPGYDLIRDESVFVAHAILTGSPANLEQLTETANTLQAMLK